jgi:hypothetical protein
MDDLNMGTDTSVKNELNTGTDPDVKKAGKKRGLKVLLIVLATLAVLVLSLWLLQRLLLPKYISSNEEGLLVKEYYDYAGGNDVLFVGDCEVYSNFSPVKMWTEYGITSAIRGSPQQLIWHSYYMLEDTLRYETPKVVVFNVLSMKYGEPQKEAYNRLALDGMKWSSVKQQAIKASMMSDETMLSYVFPILRYHSRWSELKAEDVKYMFSTKQLSHNGYVMRVDVKPVTTVPREKPLADYSFADVCWEYLDKMRTLCESKGIKLVLIKAPTVMPHWYDEWEAQIVDYADKYSLDYVNFLKEEVLTATGLDYSTDTFDAGQHMNLSGAEKLAVWFGAYLRDNAGLADHRGDNDLAAKWQSKIEYYEEMKAAQYRQLEENGKVDSYWGD